MQAPYFRHKLHLRGTKTLALIFALLLAQAAYSQRNLDINNPNYDNRLFSYGFSIGLHTTSYQMRYSDRFISNDLDTVHSILPIRSPGFSLGFIVNMRLHEFFDLRLMPKVAFYEHVLEYNFTDESQQKILKETTFVEFPLLLKYKSKRRGNVRMYVVGGVKPGFEATGKNEVDAGVESLNVRKFNTTLEAGVGFDLYFPLFKFSPELRYSKGMMNVLSPSPGLYGEGIFRLNTHTIHIYLLFQ